MRGRSKNTHPYRARNDHIRQVHDKSNHIKCDFCDYSSFQPYMLKRHIQRQHNKSTKYQCDLCPYFTYVEGTISVHKRRIHEKTKCFVCHDCNKTFDKKDDYAKHLLLTHNIVYQYN